MKVAARAHVPPFAVMEIIAAANARRAAGQHVLNLCAGEPATGASDVVRQRAVELLTSGDLGYTEALGAPALRAAIAAHYRDWYGQDVDPARIAVTTGSSGGFMLTFLAAFDVGDRVALARPGYPAYTNILAALGCEVVELPAGPQTRFQPTVEVLAEAHAVAPLDGLVIASPANPTGTMIDAAELAAVAHWCGTHGVRLVSDEIYHGITYTDAQVATAARYLEDGAVVVNSFSKYWAMTGWRLVGSSCPTTSWSPSGRSPATSPCARPPSPSTRASRRSRPRAWRPHARTSSATPARVRCCSSDFRSWAGRTSHPPTAPSTCTGTSPTRGSTRSRGARACSTRPESR